MNKAIRKAVIAGNWKMNKNRAEAKELIEAMKRLGVSPGESVMVGDGAQDILAGKNARCRTIGVTWGFRTRALLEESGAYHIVDTAEELERLLLG